MPEYEVVIVDVSPTGDVVVKTEGFTGKACLEVTAELEASLGSVTQVVPTPEMHKITQQAGQQNVAKRNQ
jgi:hypothetical protein